MSEFKLCSKCHIEKNYLNSVSEKIHRKIGINVEIAIN